ALSHIFDCPDGTLIEVKSDNARRWKSDSCDCILVFEMDTLELDFAIQVCQIHKAVRDVDLVSTVQLHNSSINLKFGNVELSELQINEISEDKINETSRIKTLGTPEIRADSGRKVQIENDLRSKNR
ncbi:MAG: hypothetical protein IH934_07645, partial [Nanoarchaeota archaeon]|nr:hypothetical protein [Nanoarchaeota archaeon]